ncbi:FACE2 [Mytilus edulis]|uniref:CAAX prenyl protease 2 n=1 Tax=Mytilus edulis TaxID=6550 RepID=A0A8S3RCM5_MYTED|nr:FACE2 [Mytilus edulis]
MNIQCKKNNVKITLPKLAPTPSLYVWASVGNKTRDHPDVIKRRFMSVAVISVIVPLLLCCFGTESSKGETLLEWMGIRFRGFFSSIVDSTWSYYDFIHRTINLTLHGWCIRFVLRAKVLDTKCHKSSLVKKPYSRKYNLNRKEQEEFIFRACMLPLLVPCFGQGLSVFLCPLFFGVAHVHHMIEKVTTGGLDVKTACKQSLFQLTYTTLFGIYSAFLFLRTGHLIAPVIAHAFCNHMGFPSFGEVMGHPQPVKHKLIASFILGLFMWIVLFYPVTTPFLYSNYIYDS